MFAESLRMNLDPLELHTDDELWRVLRQAHLGECVESLTDKLQHIVSERGANFRYDI